ncbi:hypothetical protein [Micropruina sp.]|uniref:hypothetical protein n=1 Tax=Micropruina sp. TaxID=2737536 RepID=UPI0039E569F5
MVRNWWPALVFAAHAVISELVRAWLLPGRDGDIWDVSGVVMEIAVWLACVGLRIARGSNSSSIQVRTLKSRQVSGK